MPGKKYEERKRFCALCSSIALPEISQVSCDDRFAALQIDLGWRRVTPAYRLTVRRSSFPLQFTSEDGSRNRLDAIRGIATVLCNDSQIAQKRGGYDESIRRIAMVHR